MNIYITQVTFAHWPFMLPNRLTSLNTLLNPVSTSSCRLYLNLCVRLCQPRMTIFVFLHCRTSGSSVPYWTLCFPSQTSNRSDTSHKSEQSQMPILIEKDSLPSLNKQTQMVRLPKLHNAFETISHVNSGHWEALRAVRFTQRERLSFVVCIIRAERDCFSS